MWNKNKKIILGFVGGLILLAGFGYQNCGGKMSGENPVKESKSPNMLEGRLQPGTYTVEFKDGTKVELLKPELAKYTIEFKDGTKVELLAPKM